MEALTLSGKGLAVAAAMAALFIVFGWGIWWFFIAGMVLFLVLSAVVTWFGKDYKSKKNLGQDPRGVSNVMANGTVPLIMAGLYRLSPALGAEKYAALCIIGFIASVAAITSDKFASEIGVLDGMPISLVSWKRVRKGVSGGITWLGITVSVIAALLVAVVLVCLIVPNGLPGGPYLAVLAATLGGFVGNLVDSVLGYYEEKGLGNKFTSNLACSLIGAIAGIALIIIL
jgi:uncharacterized protein (TIGR00297 family)